MARQTEHLARNICLRCHRPLANEDDRRLNRWRSQLCFGHQQEPLILREDEVYDVEM